MGSNRHDLTMTCKTPTLNEDIISYVAPLVEQSV